MNNDDCALNLFHINRNSKFWMMTSMHLYVAATISEFYLCYGWTINNYDMYALNFKT